MSQHEIAQRCPYGAARYEHTRYGGCARCFAHTRFLLHSRRAQDFTFNDPLQKSTTSRRPLSRPLNTRCYGLVAATRSFSFTTTTVTTTAVAAATLITSHQHARRLRAHQAAVYGESFGRCGYEAL